jgi:hypothetical protein
MCLGEPLQKRVYRGSTYAVGEHPVIKLEVIATEELVEPILDILNTHTVHRDIAIMSIERVIGRAPEARAHSSRPGARLQTFEPERSARRASLTDVARAAVTTAQFRLTGKPSGT